MNKLYFKILFFLPLFQISVSSYQCISISQQQNITTQARFFFPFLFFSFSPFYFRLTLPFLILLVYFIPYNFCTYKLYNLFINFY